jgi:DNA repair protein RecO (recombination protein O)
MIHRTRGIVFRTIKFSESSVVTKIYTEKFGMQSYIVNSVRSSKSKTKAAMLQAMSILDLEVYHHEHRNLNRIKELASAYIYSSLLFDPLKSSLGLFMMEVLNKCLREEEANEKMFLFISAKLQSLDRQEKIPPDFLLNFLLELSSLLGFAPQGTYGEVNSFFDLQEGRFNRDVRLHPYFLHPPFSEYFYFLINANSGKIPPGSRRKVLDALLQYYQLHVPNFSVPKSLRVLDEIFHS